ncbi:MAG TPA: VWA domain-containing protein [Phycisphaerales bacterium]|nr:VWA domain-containing protein [Phycisphaerales bacterium]HMP38010.1 VWA domain-containing protein [Phycisphaerales bacterium]
MDEDRRGAAQGGGGSLGAGGGTREGRGGAGSAGGAGTAEGGGGVGAAGVDHGATGTQGASRGDDGDFWRGRTPPAEREKVTIPEPREAERIREADRIATGRVAPSGNPMAPLNGHWRQVNVESNGPALVAGGYSEHVIAVDVDRGRLALYATFGRDARTTFGGEVAASFTERGELRILDDASTNAIFPARRLVLDGGGIVVEPPSWPAKRPMAWTLRDDRLALGDKEFARIDAATFNRLRRGEAIVEVPPDSLRAHTDGRPGPAGAENVEFFGIRSSGRHICYIVDISGSMMGDKIERLREELNRSIRGLSAGTRFFVLFFNHDKFVLDQNWITAGTAESAAFLGKLRGVGAAGGTMPLSSIEHAFGRLSPRPDTIFFMTDGITPQDVAGGFRTHNSAGPKVRVHTIAFGADADSRVLRAIASEHGGDFREVK